MLPRPHPSVVFRVVSEGAVLLHTEDELYFGLNAVGAHVWELLTQCTSVDELCTDLGEMYPGVAPDTLKADVLELCQQLRQNLLVVDPA
jgi:hypothetical protein